MLLAIKLKREINKMHPELECHFKNIKLNGANRGCSGFVEDAKTGRVMYVTTEKSCYEPLSKKNMYRMAKDLKDYSGAGINKWSEDDCLANDIVNLLKNGDDREWHYFGKGRTKVEDSMISAREYTEKLLSALHVYINNNQGYGLYEGKEGCLRLAREYGYGLKDYVEKERFDMVQSSYSILCVRVYNLKPPVDAKLWIGEIFKVFPLDSQSNSNSLIYNTGRMLDAKPAPAI